MKNKSKAKASLLRTTTRSCKPIPTGVAKPIDRTTRWPGELLFRWLLAILPPIQSTALRNALGRHVCAFVEMLAVLKAHDLDIGEYSADLRARVDQAMQLGYISSTFSSWLTETTIQLEIDAVGGTRCPNGKLKMHKVLEAWIVHLFCRDRSPSAHAVRLHIRSFALMRRFGLFHPRKRGYPEWLRMCQRFSFVPQPAISGETLNEITDFLRKELAKRQHSSSN